MLVWTCLENKRKEEEKKKKRGNEIGSVTMKI